jgi:hypothetical protein
MIPAFERAKTVHALDRAATVIGTFSLLLHYEGNFILLRLLQIEYSFDGRGLIPASSREFFFAT